MKILAFTPQQRETSRDSYEVQTRHKSAAAGVEASREGRCIDFEADVRSRTVVSA